MDETGLKSLNNINWGSIEDKILKNIIDGNFEIKL